MEVKVAQAQRKLLKRVKDSEELEMLWWRTYAVVFLWQFKE